MRIVSLLPSATEMVYALGLQDSLVGVTHECDYPPDALKKPIVVESCFPNNCKDMAPGEVDAKIGEAVRTGTPVYRFKPGALETAKPDVILAQGASTVVPLLQATRTVPVVFPIMADPVAGGFVDSLARPGGNATGFMLFEYSISGKWLQLLKQIAPDVTRVAVDRKSTRLNSSHSKQSRMPSSA